MQPSLPEPLYTDVIYDKLIALLRYIFSSGFLSLLQAIATVSIIALITVILYSLVRLYELKQEDQMKKKAALAGRAAPSSESVITVPHPDQKNNTLWEGIRAKLLSDSPSDWRVAIIEADIYLDRILDTRGWHGETIGDKLKQLTPEILGSIQIAWEAHKVRNRIAHEGAAFTLTMPEARRVLSYYEIVFRDLEVIA